MSEGEKPKRKFWQLHQSTAVLLMLVAGGFLVVNFPKNMDVETKIIPGDNGTFYGFPFVVFFEASQHPLGRVNPTGWRSFGIFLNIAVAFTTLFILALILEDIIRRRNTMGDKPMRQFWQIHLSTAVLLTFAAGAILYLATRVRQDPEYLCECDLGWPFRACHKYGSWRGEEQHVTIHYDFDWTMVILDFLLNVILLFAFAYVCERWLLPLVRRREGRKP